MALLYLWQSVRLFVVFFIITFAPQINCSINGRYEQQQQVQQQQHVASNKVIPQEQPQQQQIRSKGLLYNTSEKPPIWQAPGCHRVGK